MCGIAGVLNLSGAPVDLALLERMTGSIRHRGPDGLGVYAKDHVGFGHTRLSIIDIAGGSQPMSIADKSLWITFNGEIFNHVELREELIRKGHRFTTRSDTEVILHLYQEEGEKCVERFNGQWAFAIWDAPRRKLFLSRDRFGVRPLFYTQTPDSLLFASEIKTLLASPDVDRQLDLKALDEIFTFWVTPPPRTAFRNIRQLPPGHSMVVEKGRVRVFPYWTLDFEREYEMPEASEQRLAEEFHALLEDATRIRLRSDVPVATYLSGGLDSTYITALAKQASPDLLNTFSVTFDDNELDESPFQQEASRFLGTAHCSVRCSRDDIAAVFPEVVWHTEQPILRTAPAPLFLLSKLVRESGFKVVLTGEGADEMLGGYDIFKEAKIRRFFGQRPESSWRSLLLKRLYPYMNGIQRQPSVYLKKFFQVTPEDLNNPFFSHLPRWRLTAKLKRFFSDEVRAETQSLSPISALEGSLPGGYSKWAPLNQAEYLEASLLLPGYILSSQGDRVAMAHAVEGRYPFLDHRVVEFATKLPPRLKMKVLNQKHLLKRAAHRLVPESVRQRPKQPYRAPDGCSFFGSGASYAEELLSSDQIKDDAIFDPQAVAHLVSKFKCGRETSVVDNMALVGILSTQLLLHRFVNQRDWTRKEEARECAGLPQRC
jgi:asparagine synthase (glutamine-hydrolysing)